ncbi:MAG TPA: hypothetical protein VFQ63_02075 [Patescibacteria group bacterium]|nr:hypothetical protein [Patescibacteria group bacterium]
MRPYPSILSPFSHGAEMGGVRIPFTLAVYSGPTLREPRQNEAIHQGVNGIQVGKGLYQIDGKLSEGGMGVTYRARLHSTQEGATPSELKALPSRVVVKEMTFQIPEMFLTRATAETYVKEWRAERVAKDGLVDVLAQKIPLVIIGQQRRLRAEQDLARKMRAQMVAKVTEPSQRQVLESFLPRNPSTKQEVSRALESYYAAQLKTDILAQIPGAERKTQMDTALSVPRQRQAGGETTDTVAQRLVAYTQTPEAHELQEDLERQKAEFLREVAVLKILESAKVDHIPKAVGGLIRANNGRSGMKHIVDLFFAQTEMPGQPLSQFLRKKDAVTGDPGQTFTESYAVKAMIKYLRTLEQIQAAGFVYRDGKPENTLFDIKTGEISIVDFGIAVPVKPDVIARMKKEGIVTDAVAQGTLGYYPPEATRRIPVIDERGDTFSAAKLLYALLTAELQPDDNPVVFVNEQLMQVPDSIISRPLKAIITRGVDPQYEQRYTPAQMREQLETHLEKISRRT